MADEGDRMNGIAHELRGFVMAKACPATRYLGTCGRGCVEVCAGAPGQPVDVCLIPRSHPVMRAQGVR
jgi:hypothetical protein